MWDQLNNGAYISDYWTNTPGLDTWTSSIPRCGTSTPPPVAVGRTVSYNEGATGQCTWWAINEFHAYSGLYPNLVAPGNNGNAQYWAGNATYNGWTVSATPRVGSIAVFPPGYNGAGAYGHVAWVVAVSGTRITVTEMNYVAWNRVDTRTLTPSSTVRYILAPYLLPTRSGGAARSRRAAPPVVPRQRISCISPPHGAPDGWQRTVRRLR